jgi:hypothetical protein
MHFYLAKCVYYIKVVPNILLKPLVDLYVREEIWPCLVPKIFEESPSHRILQQMHKTLNINKKDN